MRGAKGTHWSRIGIFSAALACVSVWLSGCGSNSAAAPDSDFFTREETAVIRTLSPLPPVPTDPTNAFASKPAAAALGKLFFFDKHFSGPLVDPANADPLEGGNGSVGDTNIATDGQTQAISCYRCHDGDNAWTDKDSRPRNTSLGPRRTERHAQSLLNAVYSEFSRSDGRADSLWAEATIAVEQPHEMNFSRVGVASVIRSKYTTAYAAVFGPLPDLWFLDAFPDFAHGAAPQFDGQGRSQDSLVAPAGLPTFDGLSAAQKQAVDNVFANYGKALGAFERQLVSRDSVFDRYVAGDLTAISPQAKRGLSLFIGKGFCINCHYGPNFSDGEFHNLGVAQTGPGVPAIDRGRFDAVPVVLSSLFNGIGPYSDDVAAGKAKLSGLRQEPAQLGAFRTPSLRSVQLVGPFMHTGSLPSLWDVLAFYSRGGDRTGFAGEQDVRLRAPLSLSEPEIDDLVEFLKTLDGAPLADAVTTEPVLPR